jgi:hypothetical protein
MKPSVGPKRPQPAQQTRVEAEKLDPSVFFGSRKSPEQELLENAEPIVPQSQAMPPQAMPPQAPPTVEEPPVEERAEKEESLYDKAISDSLLDRLVKQYGLDPVKIYNVELESSDVSAPLPVSFRALTWNDYNWGIGTMADMLKSQEFSFISTDLQRSQLYQALTACRCVIKIGSHWVWDIFNLTEDIKKINTSWKGDTNFGVPPFIINMLALKVFDLFRNKLHYNLLYALEQAVRESSDAEGQESSGSEENPT